MTLQIFSRRVRALSLAAACLASAGAAQAQYLWLQTGGDGATVEARFGELGKAPQTPGDVAVSAAPDGGNGGKGGKGGDRRGVARRVEGAAGAPVLHYYQARFGRIGTDAVNDLELVPTAAGGNTFKLVWKGNAVSATQVNVDTAEGWRRVLKPAADGTVTLGTPFPGLYVLEVTARVDGSATVDGKKYDDVRHTATLSFEVPR